MRMLVLAIGVALIVTSVHAREKRHKRVKSSHFNVERIEKSLNKLGPDERLVQVCDLAAMQRIRMDQPDYKPDRVVADAVKPTVIDKNTVLASGGAFRSKKKWYALSYSCTAVDGDMKADKFEYKVGAEIPANQWTGYGLWE